VLRGVYGRKDKQWPKWSTLRVEKKKMGATLTLTCPLQTINFSNGSRCRETGRDQKKEKEEKQE
jgi:hypothetical protein